MKKLQTLGFIILFALITQHTNAQSEATFYTTKGIFIARLYDTIQPITSGNFYDLVNAKFYDSIIFHRVISGFMIQGGDPTGTGNGGPGYTIPDEFDSRASNVQKSLGMANSGPNTGGSQFYINLLNNSYLDPNYPVFGIVTTSFTVVQTIGIVPTDTNDRPLTDVFMDSVRITHVGPLGVARLKKEILNINIYPNPACEYITIDAGKNFAATKVRRIKITNILGQVVYTLGFNGQPITVSAADWGYKGIYFANLLDEKNNILETRKIIVL